MPIVDIQAPGLNAPIDTPNGFAVTPGQNDVDKGSDAPSFGRVMGAAFRQDNTVGALLSAETIPDQIEPGFNPWGSIKGTKYEPHWNSFADTFNPAAVEAKKRQIDRETEDRKTLESAPWYQSVPAQIIAGGVDLPTLLPGGAFVRSAKGGFSIARTAMNVGAAAGVSSSVQEAALQTIEETRPMSESAVNIGASVVLGGLLGAGGAKLLNKVEWNASVAAIERGFGNEPVPEAGVARAAGAAAVEPSNIEGNTIAGVMAGNLAAATKPLNPALRILQSPSTATREIGTQLFENSVYLRKNMEGVASEPAVETLMKEHNAGLAKAVQATNDIYPEYRKSGGALGKDEFRQAVGRAMRRGDQDADPFVAKAAQEWRASVFDPMKNGAIDAKLLPPDVAVDTAESYFSRMWNRNVLIAREGEFKDIVSRWVNGQWDTWARSFDADTAKGSAKLKDEKLADYLTERRIERDARFGDDPRQAGLDVSSEVFDTLTGKVEAGARPEFLTVKARGPLKERTFNIPDHLVEDFLEHDVEMVGRRYARVMSADIELARKFGSVDLVDQIGKIRDDYKKLRAGLTDEKQLTKLGEAEKADVRDIEALRDLLRGTRQESPVERNYSRIIRSANHVNYIRSMGEVVLASLTDAVRPAMVHGLSQYMQTVGQLMTNMQGIKLSVGEAKLAGNVAEQVLGHRLATLSEIIDPYASRGPIESFLENMTNVASKWNGIRVWTDMGKSVASVMTQNRILGNVEKFGAIKQSEKAYMAYLGIDESMAGRIADQFGKHGEMVGGVRVANTEEWTDTVAIRFYRAAMNKDVDSIIVQKGVADVPLFANTPTGKALLQFKSFALASHQRILLRGLQEDQSRFLGGMVAMTTMGMFVTWLKAQTGNRAEKQSSFTDNPGWWISEGLDRSGVLAVPMEIANTFEKGTGFNPLKAPIKAFDQGNALSQKNQSRNEVGSLLGPTIGMGQDLMNAGTIPKRMVTGEEITQGQKNSAERLLPFNSYTGVRQILRYLVNTPD